MAQLAQQDKAKKQNQYESGKEVCDDLRDMLSAAEEHLHHSKGENAAERRARAAAVSEQLGFDSQSTNRN